MVVTESGWCQLCTSKWRLTSPRLYTCAPTFYISPFIYLKVRVRLFSCFSLRTVHTMVGKLKLVIFEYLFLLKICLLFIALLYIRCINIDNILQTSLMRHLNIIFIFSSRYVPSCIYRKIFFFIWEKLSGLCLNHEFIKVIYWVATLLNLITCSKDFSTSTIYQSKDLLQSPQKVSPPP